MLCVVDAAVAAVVEEKQHTNYVQYSYLPHKLSLHNFYKVCNINIRDKNKM